MNLERVIAVRNNKTVYRDGDKAIKVFDANFSKSDILNEALNQARVEEAGIRVPKVLEVSVIDGKWAIVSEYIPGKTLAQLMEENPQDKDAYLEQFVDLQMEVHTHRAPLLNKLHDKMKRKIDETGLDATTRYELHTRLDSTPITIRSATGISTPPTSSCRRTAPISWIGPMPPRQRLRGRGPDLSSVLAERGYRWGEEVPEPLLQEERHRPANMWSAGSPS